MINTNAETEAVKRLNEFIAKEKIHAKGDQLMNINYRYCSLCDEKILIEPIGIFVKYDDVVNNIPNVMGNISDFEAFCKMIERGRIKNVRLENI